LNRERVQVSYSGFVLLPRKFLMVSEQGIHAQFVHSPAHSRFHSSRLNRVAATLAKSSISPIVLGTNDLDLGEVSCFGAKHLSSESVVQLSCNSKRATAAQGNQRKRS
jgi:hypothetical protein